MGTKECVGHTEYNHSRLKTIKYRYLVTIKEQEAKEKFEPGALIPMGRTVPVQQKVQNRDYILRLKARYIEILEYQTCWVRKGAQVKTTDLVNAFVDQQCAGRFQDRVHDKEAMRDIRSSDARKYTEHVIKRDAALLESYAWNSIIMTDTISSGAPVVTINGEAHPNLKADTALHMCLEREADLSKTNKQPVPVQVLVVDTMGVFSKFKSNVSKNPKLQTAHEA